MHRTPLIAAVLSVAVPGLGQLRNGERAKGVAMLCMTAGIWFWMAMATAGPEAFRSSFTCIILGITYLFVLGPAVSDAYRGATGAVTATTVSAKTWYIIFMVLMMGAMAVPLVWQSPRLSRRARYIWSAIGILNTLCALLVIAVVGPWIDRLLQLILVMLESAP